ncbi:MAG: molybdopterin-dependent oxidoreductase [Gallionella sp.]|nr:molybdopterin-dependent oxidoreductase [Gallionella sp.]MDD4947782.1 molybdopterin-dependent oxidoreductase [Gallionella sp.]
MRLIQILLLVVIAVCSTLSVAADIVVLAKPLPAVTGKDKPLLTLTHAGMTYRLSLAEIERLPMYQTRLTTQWGMSGTFQGVLMSDLLKAYRMTDAKRLSISALDNYDSTLAMREFQTSQGFLATRLEGKPIPLENKGPLILLWPSKEEDALQGRATMTSWVWSISSIDAK